MGDHAQSETSATTVIGTDEVVVKRADLLRVVIKAERIARDETTERLRARLERS